MPPENKKHWSNVFGPLLQPTQSRSSQKEFSGEEARKMLTAMHCFRKHQISDEARAIIDSTALVDLDETLKMYAKIIFPHVEEFYPDGLREYPEIIEALSSWVALIFKKKVKPA